MRGLRSWPACSTCGPSPSDFAQRYWTTLVLKAGDTVIDATVGNGHDAAVLAKALGRAGGGTLLCLDAQAVALERSQERLRGVLAEWELREPAPTSGLPCSEAAGSSSSSVGYM